MAGVPHHAASGYVQRLLEQGFKVAICEQMADPSKVKGLVPREVVRVVTPGIAFDDAGIAPRAEPLPRRRRAREGTLFGIAGARPLDGRAVDLRGERPGVRGRRSSCGSTRASSSSVWPMVSVRRRTFGAAILRARPKLAVRDESLTRIAAADAVAHPGRAPRPGRGAARHALGGCPPRRRARGRVRPARPSPASRSPSGASRPTSSATRSSSTRRRRRTSSSCAARRGRPRLPPRADST